MFMYLMSYRLITVKRTMKTKDMMKTTLFFFLFLDLVQLIINMNVDFNIVCYYIFFFAYIYQNKISKTITNES